MVCKAKPSLYTLKPGDFIRDEAGNWHVITGTRNGYTVTTHDNWCSRLVWRLRHWWRGTRPQVVLIDPPSL